MWFSTTVHAYDVLEVVHVTASVRVRDDDGTGPAYSEFAYTTTFPGIGESDPTEWLKDALVALLETL